MPAPAILAMVGSPAAVGGGPWTPASLPSLVAWFDPSDLATITASGGLVTQWNNKAPSAAHVTASGSARPTSGTRTINSLNVLDFDGISSTGNKMSFAVNPCAAATSATAVYAFAADADPGGPQNGAVLGGFSPSASGSHFLYSDGTLYDTFGSTAQQNCGNPTPSWTVPHVYSVMSAANDWRDWIDGTSFKTNATNTVGWHATNMPEFGVARPGDIFRWDGRMAEIIICATALSTTDRQAAESYLKTKWGTP